MRSLGTTGPSSFQPILSKKSPKSEGLQPNRARSFRMAPSTGASRSNAPMSMCAMSGAAKAKRGSRQARVAVNAPPSERPATPTGLGRLVEHDRKKGSRIENRFGASPRSFAPRRPSRSVPRRTVSCAAYDGRGTAAEGGRFRRRASRAIAPNRPCSSTHRFGLHVAVDVEKSRTPFGSLGAMPPCVDRLDAPAARVVVRIEQRLDRLVLARQRSSPRCRNRAVTSGAACGRAESSRGAGKSSSRVASS